MLNCLRIMFMFMFIFMCALFGFGVIYTSPVEIVRTCAYQVVRNVRFSENLVCFVFLKHPFWDSPLCLITDETSYLRFLALFIPLTPFSVNTTYELVSLKIIFRPQILQSYSMLYICLILTFICILHSYITLNKKTLKIKNFCKREILISTLKQLLNTTNWT